MNQDNKTRQFYNEYASKEWERLDGSPYDRLNFILHMDFIKDYLDEDVNLIDVGCGAGRFSIEFAKAGCDVTLFDISDTQLKLAEDNMKKYGVHKKIVSVNQGSVSDMNNILDDTYDVVVCYGAPLNYLFDNYEQGIKELYRITKPGGMTFASVNSRLGVFRMLMAGDKHGGVNFFGRPDYWYINEVLETGNLKEHPEVSHPSRHMFTASELKNLFGSVGFKNIELASSPAVSSGLRNNASELYADEIAWKTLVDIELSSYQNEYLADCGEFLMIRAKKE